MNKLSRIPVRATQMICLTPRNLAPGLMGIPPHLFPAEPWHAVLKAAVDEGWKPEYPISDYCIDDCSESAKQSLTSGWDFADALKWAAERIPEDFDHFAPSDDFHLAWFIERDKSLLADLMEFARRSGGFEISWPTT